MQIKVVCMQQKEVTTVRILNENSTFSKHCMKEEFLKIGKHKPAIMLRTAATFLSKRLYADVLCLSIELKRLRVLDNFSFALHLKGFLSINKRI